ncbi:MAG: CDP-diacylglycerol--glycerol-3-phosphate 3-phosphatidyltransferase [Akkermansia sp.]
MPNLPNSITLARIALVVVFTVAISIAPKHEWGYPLALFSFLLAAFSDWLDGFLARKLKLVTTFGKLIDPLADKIAVSAAIIYLTAVGYCPVWASILIIGREFLVTGIRQIAQDHQIIIAADRSGKWKTVFQLAFCTGGLLVMMTTRTSIIFPNWISSLSYLCNPTLCGANLYNLTFWGSIILTVWSGTFYCVKARKFLFQ